MRELATAERIRRFIRGLGAEARVETAGYLTGGGTAVLLGWRQATVDVDVMLVPESDPVLRGIARYRFPAIDPPAFRRRVEAVLGEALGQPPS